MHNCPKTGCNRRVRDDLLACKPHWFLVSAPTRQLVWDTYRRAPGSAEHTLAVGQAIDEMNAAGGTGG